MSNYLNSGNEINKLIQHINADPRDIQDILHINQQIENSAERQRRSLLFEKQMEEGAHLVNRTINTMSANIISPLMSDRIIMNCVIQNSNGPMIKTLSSGERIIVFSVNSYPHIQPNAQLTLLKEGLQFSQFGNFGIQLENINWDIDLVQHRAKSVFKYILFNFSNNTEVKSFLQGMKRLLNPM